jgi:hypothetical protein
MISINKLKKLISEQLDEMDYDSFREAPEFEELRKSINSNKVVSVAFVKSDGSVRHMAIKKIGSYKYSAAPKTDAERDQFKNHDMIAAVDINLYIKALSDFNGDKQKAASKSFRKIKLQNVLGFFAGGKFYDVRDENKIKERYGDEIYNSLTKNMINSMNKEKTDAENIDVDDKEQLNEIGDASAYVYPIGELEKGFYYFLTDSGTEMGVKISGNDYLINIDFGEVKQSGDDVYLSFTQTNKSEQYKILSTVINAVKKYVKNYPEYTKKVSGIKFYASDGRRKNFYMNYLNRLLGDYVEIETYGNGVTATTKDGMPLDFNRLNENNLINKILSKILKS